MALKFSGLARYLQEQNPDDFELLVPILVTIYNEVQGSLGSISLGLCTNKRQTMTVTIWTIKPNLQKLKSHFVITVNCLCSHLY